MSRHIPHPIFSYLNFTGSVTRFFGSDIRKNCFWENHDFDANSGALKPQNSVTSTNHELESRISYVSNAWSVGVKCPRSTRVWYAIPDWIPPEVPAIPGNLCILPKVPVRSPSRWIFLTPANAWSASLSLETYQTTPRYLTCGARPFFNASSADAKPFACANASTTSKLAGLSTTPTPFLAINVAPFCDLMTRLIRRARSSMLEAEAARAVAVSSVQTPATPPRFLQLAC